MKRYSDRQEDRSQSQQEQQDKNYNKKGFTGQTGGEWGEDIHDTPYNTTGGYINTNTNYDQGNYDYSESRPYGFARGDQYGEDRVNNSRNYEPDRRQQSSYPSDAFSGQDFGDQDADQTQGQSFGNRRNAAYDEARFRSGGKEYRGNSRRGQTDYGRADYGAGAENSRTHQPGFDHGAQHQNRRGYYSAHQGGFPNQPNETSFGQENYNPNSQRGKGPKNYQRNDQRILEDINDRLTDDRHIDASDIEVSVQHGEVILSGQADSRQAKRHAADLAEAVSGVRHLENRIRVRDQHAAPGSNAAAPGDAAVAGSQNKKASGRSGKKG